MPDLSKALDVTSWSNSKDWLDKLVNANTPFERLYVSLEKRAKSIRVMSVV